MKKNPVTNINRPAYPTMVQLKKQPGKYPIAKVAAVTALTAVMAIAATGCGEENVKSNTNNHRLVDWDKDSNLICSAINNVTHQEIRSLDYLHWWTFMGYFMEIREGTYAQVLNLRQKRAKGKKLEKWEQEFWRTNKDICRIRKKLSEDEKAEQELLKKLLDG